MAYVVTAPYIQLKVTDQVSGGWVMLGFHAGAMVPSNVDAESLRHHVDGGMVSKADEPSEPEPEVKTPAKPTPAAKK